METKIMVRSSRSGSGGAQVYIESGDRNGGVQHISLDYEREVPLEFFLDDLHGFLSDNTLPPRPFGPKIRELITKTERVIEGTPTLREKAVALVGKRVRVVFKCKDGGPGCLIGRLEGVARWEAAGEIRLKIRQDSPDPTPRYILPARLISIEGRWPCKK